jgi:HEPN domain-containing protein
MTIDDLVASGRAQRVPQDAAAQERLLEDADLHLSTAGGALKNGDLAGAYQLAYDAARKALTALLNSEGLRTKGLGSHMSTIEIASELFPGSATSFERLDRLRRTRNESEYSGHFFDPNEVARDIGIASSIVGSARRELE